MNPKTSSPSAPRRSPTRGALRGEFVVPAILAVITLGYLISALQLGPPMKNGNMTPSFFPIATAIVMLIALVFAMVHAFRMPADTDETRVQADTDGGDATVQRRYVGLSPGAIGVVLLTAGYLLAFTLIGYFVSTFVYVLLLCGLFGGSFKRQWLTKVITAIVITLAGYLLFEVVFQVRLPTFWSQ